MVFQLAPMAELSHRALRELIEDFGGCDAYFTEMISAAALFAGGPFEKWYIDSGPRPEKLVYQLAGADIGQIVKAAAWLDSRECAGIDLNMGCSAPLIRKSGAGIAWMKSADRAGELVNKVRKAVKQRLSVKLRIGFTEDFDYLVRFCRRLEQEGADFITLHPRTASEKFKRRARWEYVADLRRELRIPVAGNGDIADAAGLLSRAQSCDAVMAGRAAVRQPWIFAMARELEFSPNSSHKGTEITKTQREEEDSEESSRKDAETQRTQSLNSEVSKHRLTLASSRLGVNKMGENLVKETGLQFIELLSQIGRAHV